MVEVLPARTSLLIYRDGRVAWFKRGEERPTRDAFEGLAFAVADGGVLLDMLRDAERLPDALEALRAATEGEDCWGDHPQGETASGVAVCLSDDCHLATADRLLVEDYETAQPIVGEGSGVP